MIYLPPLRRFLLPALASVTLIILYRAIPLSHTVPSFVVHQAPAPSKGIHVPFSALEKPLPLFNASSNHLSPPNDYFYDNGAAKSTNPSSSILWQPILDPSLAPLFQCSRKGNQHTGHIRLPHIIQNISQVPSGPLLKPETRTFWNPTIIALPYWSQNQYLIVSRIVTDGQHQENVLCEANICYVGSAKNARPGEKQCTLDDIKHVGPAGGMRCAGPPITLSVPPTPAEQCEGKFTPYAYIPGFHDPRIFWSGKGEPLMMINTQSRYACFGLWIIDLRTLYPSLQNLLASSPTHPSLGPLKSYPTLTELTRNPPSTRSAIEKNWMLFFPTTGESYIHYELPAFTRPVLSSRGRTFAKLLGNGLTTTNLTSPLEQPCLDDSSASASSLKSREAPTPVHLEHGSWHQATNSLRLVLCNRHDDKKKCRPTPQNTVFVAVIQRKFPNMLKLPLRYERFFVAWSATPPFGMLGVSSHPMLLFNETASGFPPEQNWDDDEDDGIESSRRGRDLRVRGAQDAQRTSGGKNASETASPHGKTSSSKDKKEKDRKNWAGFTYTVSMAYAWGRGGGRQPSSTSTSTDHDHGKYARRSKDDDGGEKIGDEVEDMHVGYLDDEVVLGIGVDDVGQSFARVRMKELVGCMRACPGMGPVQHGEEQQQQQEEVEEGGGGSG